ncbi:MAG: TorD/DmsD family molecular chaperone [Halanaeroarchaeum sp.]
MPGDTDTVNGGGGAVSDGYETGGYVALAACWREPTEALVTAVNDGAFGTVFERAPPVDHAALEREYTRLFVGPGEHPCPPYESVYRDAEPDQEVGPVMGPSTQAVERWYREHGLVLDDATGELPDHVATELEFVGHLHRTAGAATAERFLDEHPRQWLGPFLDRVATATESPFYRELVTATRVATDTPTA